jgi:aminoglycoside 6'-N-acetyltransferase
MILDENIAIRLMEDKIEDYTLMSKWLTDPNVLQYYEGRDNPFNIDRIIAKYKPRILDNSNIASSILQYNSIEIGYIQYYHLTSEEYLEFGYDKQEITFGIDLFIGEMEYWNKGIGFKALKLVIKMLEKEKKASRIAIAPQTWNARAIKCYEKCGFKKIRLLKKHELHEGEYKDCLLMEIKL